MNKVKFTIIGVALSFFLIMVPVTVIGAIVENPVDFIGDLIFETGDTTAVSYEIEELYNEFLKSTLGKQTLEYISKKNDKQENIYDAAYYVFPLLLVTEENKNATFESLCYSEKLDVLYELRYTNSDHFAYIHAVKNHNLFKKISSLSDTTLMTYINHFMGTSADENHEITGDSVLGNTIAEKALTKLGCPYYWGASGPNYFDCSGLVYWACRESGLSIPRVTADSYSNMGQAITRDQLIAGDVITFDYEKNGRADHIGIYIGNGKMVHASGEGSTCLGNHASKGHVVKVVDVLNSDYWNRVIYKYRRLY